VDWTSGQSKTKATEERNKAARNSFISGLGFTEIQEAFWAIA
jgi:hypothetical protein